MKTVYVIEDGNYFNHYPYTNDFYFTSKKEAEDFLHNRWNMKFNKEQELYLNDKSEKWARLLAIHPYNPKIDL
jgi:hypothetical protein